MDIKQLLGQSDTHLCEVFPGYFLHEQVLEPYLELVELAAKSGLALRLASAYRSFDRQLDIWNAKACGQRPVLDDAGCAIALTDLSELDKVYALLRWSALPGASRHHWGSDVDVWDASVVGIDYRPRLLAEEYMDDGVFSRLSQWLDELLVGATSGFYRPYARDRQGVGPEPWHLSYRPVAESFERRRNQDLLREVLEQADILLKETILDNFDEIYQRFVVQSCEL